MQYTLKLPAISEDIVPLEVVAVAMAEHYATAGNTPFHEAAYKGRLTDCTLMLLEEVRSGRLQVCDNCGRFFPVDSSIEATAHFGYAQKFVKEPDWEKLKNENPPVGHSALGPVYNFSHLKFGPTEKDEARPRIAWQTKLKTLNEWAEKRGDVFTISYECGWIDERGYIPPIEVDLHKKARSKPNLKRKSKQETITPDHWITVATTICDELRKKFPLLNQGKLSEKAHEEMQKRHSARKPGMTNRSGRVPTAGSIKRWAFKKSSR